MIRKLSMLICVTFILATPTWIAAQDPPDIALSGFEGKFVTVTDYTPKFEADKTGDLREDYRRWNETTPYQGMVRKYAYEPQVTVENRGPKAIQAITWECTLFLDSAKTKVIQRYKLHTKNRIASGESAVLKDRQPFVKFPSPHQNVRVLKIEYADGSVWRQP